MEDDYRLEWEDLLDSLQLSLDAIKTLHPTQLGSLGRQAEETLRVIDKNMIKFIINFREVEAIAYSMLVN